MAFNRQFPKTPHGTDIGVINLTGADITEGSVVCLDTTAANLVPTYDGFSVVLPATGGNPDTPLGVLLENAKASGGQARCRTFGPIVPVVCDGAVTVKGLVDASVTTAGRVKAHTAAKVSMGMAMMTGADGDTILVMLLGPAPNA